MLFKGTAGCDQSREKGDPFQAKSSNGIEKFDRKTRPAEASISSPPALLACSSVHVIKMMRGGRCISCLARFCGIKGISFDPTGQLSDGCPSPVRVLYKNGRIHSASGFSAKNLGMGIGSICSLCSNFFKYAMRIWYSIVSG